MSETPQPNRSPLSGRAMVAWALGGLLVSLGVAVLCSFSGELTLPHGAALLDSPVWQARLIRLLAAAVVGVALGGAGLALQAMLRNPLAEPYILGISSGAGVGVLIGVSLGALLNLADWATGPALAMIGALATAAIVYAIAQRHGRLDPYVLLLGGVIVNVFNGALILAILQFVKPTDMIHYIGWGMGRIPDWLWFQPGRLAMAGTLVLIGWAMLFLRASTMNTLTMGDEVAASLGVRVHALRIELFITVSLMTAAAVALAGPVGFVGLIVPHIARLLLGPDHRRLMIVAPFGGALFLMLADTFCRSLPGWLAAMGLSLRLGELPVGVITALCGGPFFIVLLRRRRGGGA